MKAVVLGFGPFLDVTDNPAARLAEAVDGALDGRVVGRVMPVSYARCLQVTREVVEAHQPTVLLGVGVARTRSEAMLECLARPRCNDVPDVDGACGTLAGDLRLSTLPTHFVNALDVRVSDDAGGYVCNAWLYGALELPVRAVGFLHVPPAGFEPDRLVRALDGLRPSSTQTT